MALGSSSGPDVFTALDGNTGHTDQHSHRDSAGLGINTASDGGRDPRGILVAFGANLGDGNQQTLAAVGPSTQTWSWTAALFRPPVASRPHQPFLTNFTSSVLFLAAAHEPFRFSFSPFSPPHVCSSLKA